MALVAAPCAVIVEHQPMAEHDEEITARHKVNAKFIILMRVRVLVRPGWPIQNDIFCITNDGFCNKSDELTSLPAEQEDRLLCCKTNILQYKSNILP